VTVGRGFLVAGVAVLIVAIVISRTDAWERFNGSDLAKVTFDLQVSGAQQIASRGAGMITRNSSWAGRDGYELQLAGKDVALALTSRLRFVPGTYAVNSDSQAARDTIKLMGASLWFATDGPVFWGDSGYVRISQDGARLRGTYQIFLTNKFNPTRGELPPHAVVRGEFLGQIP